MATFTCTTGSWEGPADSYTYQWQRSSDLGVTWANIDGATTNSYTPTEGDDPVLLRCAVTAINLAGVTTGYSNTVAVSSTAEYQLLIAFDASLAGVFTLDSELDGADVLTDSPLLAGTFTDVSDDSQDSYQVVAGTDNLMTAVQAANLTATVARVDEPDFWNPNNPASPLNATNPGFVPMRPAKLLATTLDGNVSTLFAGYLRHATWNSQTRACELYFEDFYLWASRVYPVIASTGPTNVGTVFAMLVAEVDPTLIPVFDPGPNLDDFSADGTLSVTQILANLQTATLGAFFANMDGTPVYEQNDTPLARDVVATVTLTLQASDEQSGIDLDDIGTRVAVSKTDPVTGSTLDAWTAVDAVAEYISGRADLNAISSPYVDDGQALANEVVIRGVAGKPPVQFTLANVDQDTLLLMLTSQLQTVFTVDDDFGGTAGDVIVQQMTHTIRTGLHQAQYLCVARPQKAFTLESELDGLDVLRYP
jgi:hypothetical protein